MKKFFISAAVIAISVSFAACENDNPKEDDGASAKEFSVSPTSISLAPGGEVQITANPGGEKYLFESTAVTVATVSSTGLVKAVGEGMAAIKVSLGKTVKEIPVSVIISIPVSGISVTPASLTLETDGEETLQASLLPANHTEQGPLTLKWESLDMQVATVDETGKVKAVGGGETKVVVSLLSNSSVKTEIPVLVGIPVTGIETDKTSVELFMAGTTSVTVVATPLPTNHTGDTPALTWESSAPSVATVTGGQIQAVASGTATITVSLQSDPEIKATIGVTVYATVINVGVGTTLDTRYSSLGKINFVKNGLIYLEGIAKERYAEVYNRDFFIYDAVNGTVKFDGPTGEYDIYYYNYDGNSYINVSRLADVSPACLWAQIGRAHV